MAFLKTPNLPQSKVKLVLADERISAEIEDSLIKLNVEIIKIKKCNSLQQPIASHPDMLSFYSGDGDIILAPEIYDDYCEALENRGFNVIKGSTLLGSQYPYDIPYNAAYNGEYLICNDKYTDLKVKQLCERKGAKIIYIKQGYAKCSICFITESAIITSDAGITQTLKRYGFDILFIQAGDINLDGYNTGFLGGSSGKLDKDLICFCGNLNLHPDYRKINAFISKYGCKPISLSNDKIYDYGSIIPIYNV